MLPCFACRCAQTCVRSNPKPSCMLRQSSHCCILAYAALPASQCTYRQAWLAGLVFQARLKGRVIGHLQSPSALTMQICISGDSPPQLHQEHT